jgi:hypothetical protein
MLFPLGFCLHADKTNDESRILIFVIRHSLLLNPNLISDKLIRHMLFMSRYTFVSSSCLLVLLLYPFQNVLF